MQLISPHIVAMASNIRPQIPPRTPGKRIVFSRPKMHEIFLSTFVLGKELDFYLRVLQGICIMQPNHFFHRRIVFEGPRAQGRGQLKGIQAEFIKSQGPKEPLWRNMHEQLVRQSYYLTGSWEVEKEGFGRRGDEEGLS